MGEVAELALLIDQYRHEHKSCINRTLSEFIAENLLEDGYRKRTGSEVEIDGIELKYTLEHNIPAWLSDEQMDALITAIKSNPKILKMGGSK